IDICSADCIPHTNYIIIRARGVEVPCNCRNRFVARSNALVRWTTPTPLKHLVFYVAFGSTPGSTRQAPSPGMYFPFLLGPLGPWWRDSENFSRRWLALERKRAAPVGGPL